MGAAQTVAAVNNTVNNNPGLLERWAGATVSMVQALHKWWIGPIQQCKLIKGQVCEGADVYREEIVRKDKCDYIINHSVSNGMVIVGLAVTPVSESIASPNANLINGGLGSTNVIIQLVSPGDMEWGCVFRVATERTVKTVAKVKIYEFNST